MALRTHITILNEGASHYPSNPAFKLPRLDARSGRVADWIAVTYSQFVQDVDLYAKHLLDTLNLQAGTTVAVWTGGVRYVDVLHVYGLSRAGYIPQLIAGNFQDVRTATKLVLASGAGAILLDSDLEFPSSFPIRTYRMREVIATTRLEAITLEPWSSPRSPDDTAIVYNTAGTSTGSPRLVRCSYRWLDVAIGKAAHIMQPRSTIQQDVAVWMGSIANSMQHFLFMGAHVHGSCIIQPTHLDYNSNELIDMIARCQLNRLTLTGSSLSNHLSNSRTNTRLLFLLSSLDDIIYFNSEIPNQAEEWARSNGLSIRSVFGNTECGIMMVSIGGQNPLSHFFQPLPRTSYQFQPITPTAQTQYHNINSKLVELVVGSSNTDFPSDPPSISKDGCHHTGDIFIEVFPNYYAIRGHIGDWITMKDGVREMAYPRSSGSQ
ncbi:hypothetical protein ABKN59_006785 [Abortiporus biennis]